jgi:hypothetical protein
VCRAISAAPLALVGAEQHERSDLDIETIRRGRRRVRRDRRQGARPARVDRRTLVAGGRARDPQHRQPAATAHEQERLSEGVAHREAHDRRVAAQRHEQRALGRLAAVAGLRRLAPREARDRGRGRQERQVRAEVGERLLDRVRPRRRVGREGARGVLGRLAPRECDVPDPRDVDGGHGADRHRGQPARAAGQAGRPRLGEDVVHRPDYTGFTCQNATREAC